MRRPQEIARDRSAMATIVELTSAFEGIASMRISQIKNQVLDSKEFFSELWNIYRQLAAGVHFQYGRSQSDVQVVDKDLLIAITAEGSFSGDIDQKLINAMLQTYNPAGQAIIVIGHHGAIQLAQAGIEFEKYFKLPEKDQNINVSPLIREVQRYRSTIVYYQTYKSLMVQEVIKIDLSKAVQEQGKTVSRSSDEINEQTYIFEPSMFAVVDHLERSMMQIALSQVILESKLAQYASRFRAMSMAHTKADSSLADLHLLYNRAKRSAKDERLKEIMNGLHQARLQS